MSGNTISSSTVSALLTSHKIKHTACSTFTTHVRDMQSPKKPCLRSALLPLCEADELLLLRLNSLNSRRSRLRLASKLCLCQCYLSSGLGLGLSVPKQVAPCLKRCYGSKGHPRAVRESKGKTSGCMTLPRPTILS